LLACRPGALDDVAGSNSFVPSSAPGVFDAIVDVAYYAAEADLGLHGAIAAHCGTHHLACHALSAGEHA